MANQNKNDTHENWFSRSVSLVEDSERGLKTIDKEKRTVEATIASESIAQVVDWSRYEIVDEILLMKGMVVPPNNQVPLLNNHSRHDLSMIVGSARGIKKEGEMSSAVLHFSSLRSDEWTLAEEGHLTDVSVGYRVDPNETVVVAPGETASVNGRSYKNDGERTLLIRKKWYLKEVSLTPIGADTNAKTRSETNTNSEGGAMPEPVVVERTETPVAPVAPVQPQRSQADIDAEIERKANEKAIVIAARKESNEKEMIARATLLDLTEEEARTACKDVDMTSEKADTEIWGKLSASAKQKREAVSVDTSVKVRKDGFDNFRQAAVLSILHMGNRKITEQEESNLRKSELYGVGLLGICRAYLMQNGVGRAAFCSAPAVYEELVKLRQSRSFAIGSGDLSNVFLDAANKSMFQGWTEAPTTYQLWTGKDSIPDFKTKNLVKITNVGDVEEILEGEGFPFTALNDSKETASLKTWGLAISVSRKAIINDDLSVLTDLPSKLAAAIRRHINRKVYTFLYGTNMAGPTMGEDSKAMFHADHSNLVAVSSGGAPTTTTLATGRRAMMKQTLPTPDGGKAEVQYTNIAPRYILAHMNLDAAIEQLVNSTTDNTTAGDNKPNLQFIRRLAFIGDPILDELMDAYSSNTGHNGWYLLADPREMPTINVFSLTGYEAPTMRSKISDVAEPLGTTMDVYFDYNVGQVDYRGAYANFGR